MKFPRVILADDHTIVREAFRKLLELHCEVVASVVDERALLEAAFSLDPDLILVDVAMPLLNGLEAARRLRVEHPRTKIVFLTMNDDPDIALEAMRVGASGYLLKTSVASELFHAIHEVFRGRSYVTPGIAQGMEESFARGPRKNGKIPTARQREVIQLLAEGKAMKEVADIMNITSRTVAFHKYRAMEDLGFKTTADLIQYAVRTQIVAA
jgi:DNA-binding NarL/FixJ family response regulator